MAGRHGNGPCALAQAPSPEVDVRLYTVVPAVTSTEPQDTKIL